MLTFTEVQIIIELLERTPLSKAEAYAAQHIIEKLLSAVSGNLKESTDNSADSVNGLEGKACKTD